MTSGIIGRRERYKRKYKERKAKGLCGCLGCNNLADRKKHFYCDYCLNKKRELLKIKQGTHLFRGFLFQKKFLRNSEKKN